MKIITDNTATIERIGVGADQAFKINFDAKMARILADGLYSDKVQSVIRELSCNAYDSQVMAGCADTPIEVHFPNRFEPWFHVRDFGTGLSHDEVLNIYTTYGASTKTNSNDVIGQLGLGSKSPFSLADAFTVTTRKDGIENHYSMYRSESGMPSVAHLHSQATTEPNGVTVTVPIDNSLRDEFVRKAQEVYKWFPIKPVAIGDTVTYEAVEYSYQGSNWGIRNSRDNRQRYGYYRNHTTLPVALMGLVAYPLDVNSVKGLGEGAKYLLSLPFVLKFDIGELEVAANREALGYDDRTCVNIVAKMNTVIAELGTQFEQDISGAKSLWDARKKFGEIFHKSDFAYEFGNAYRNLGLRWKNIVIKESTCKVDMASLYPTNNAGTIARVEAEIYESNHRCKRPRKIQFSSSNELAMDCEQNTVIVFNDVKLGGMTRVMEYNKAKDHKLNIFVFNPSSTSSWTKIANALGNPDVVYTSTLPKPPRKESKRTGMLCYNGHYAGGKRSWSEVEIDLDQGGYYVELDGWDLKHGDGYISDLNWWINNSVSTGMIPANTKVYAMRHKNKKAVRELDGWVEFFGDVKQKLIDKIEKSNLAQTLVNSEEYRRLNDYTQCRFWVNSEVMTRISDPTSPAVSFATIALDYAENSGNRSLVESLRSMANRFNITIEQAAVKHNLVNLYNEIVKRYPMLRIVGNRSSYSYSSLNSDEWKLITDYINYIDSTYVFYALQEREAAE